MTLKQQSSFGPGVYRGRKFDLAKLQLFADGTNRAIAAGIPVPLLKRHAPIDAGDKATLQFAKEEGAGWVTKVGVDAEAGGLWWEAKDVPTDIAKDVIDNRYRFTSPEFRPVYNSEKAGVFSGPMIRHFAFSYKPGNPHQGPIEVKDESAMALDESETAWQFDEAEKEPLGETEQFDDQYGDSHQLLKKHGYHLLTDDSRRRIYGHKGEAGHKQKGHSVDLYPGGKWTHYHSEPTTTGHKSVDVSGKGHEALEKHISSRYPSQHDESEKGDFTPTDATKSRSDSEAPLEEKADDPTTNPDMPPKATDKSKLNAIIAGLAQKNVVVPSDWDPTKEGAMDILLGCLNSAISAENQAEAEAEPDDPDDEPVTDSPMPFSEDEFHNVATRFGYKPNKSRTAYKRGKHYIKKVGNGYVTSAAGGSTGVGHEDLGRHLQQQHGNSTQHDEQSTSPNGASVMFTKEEIAAMPEALRAKAEQQNAACKTATEKAQQFDEERKTALNTTARSTAITAVTAAKIPAGLKSSLLGGYKPAKEGEEAAIQFDEGEELPTYTAVQVAEMVAKALPPHLQFDENDPLLKDTKTPTAKRQIGHDGQGNPVYSEESSEQFFETEGDTNTAGVGSTHVSPDRAEALVAANPSFRSKSRRRTSLSEDVADNTRRNPSQMLR